MHILREFIKAIILSESYLTPNFDKLINDPDLRMKIMLLGHAKNKVDFNVVSRIIMNFSKTFTTPLYRGLVKSESISGVKSFSEDLNIAKKFAKSYESNMIMKLNPPGIGFCFCDFYDDCFKFDSQRRQNRLTKWEQDAEDELYRIQMSEREWLVNVVDIDSSTIEML